MYQKPINSFCDLDLVNLEQIFDQTEIVCYGATQCSFHPNSKNKKIHMEKISCIPRKWNFLAVISKKLLYFLKRKLFFYFRKWKPWENSLYFLKKKVVLIFRKTETLKNYLYFRKPNFLIFQEKPQKPKFIKFLQKTF